MNINDFLDLIGEVVSASIVWMQQYISVILNNPALVTICIGFPIVSKAVSLVTRLIRL